MNKRIYYNFALSSILILISGVYSCKKDVVEKRNRELYSNFYPLQESYWAEYSVDSIVHLNYDDQYLVDTAILSYHFYLREQIDSTFIDGEGDVAYMMSRYKRNADSLPWDFTAIWTAKLNSSSLQRVEDNRRYVRLSFPFNPLFNWNGNAYNELPEEEYSYEDIYSDKTFSSLNFDSTVTVNQNEFISNINRIIRKEIYGNHVGLLYKQNDSVGVAFTINGQIILSGLEYSQTIIDYKH